MSEHLNNSQGDYDPGREHSNGARAFDTLRRFLEEDGWHPNRLEGREVYRMNFQGKSGLFQCFAQLRVEAEQLICYAKAPVNAPEESRPAVAEYLTRANYGMFIGNFEMDYNDGEVRFKSSIDFEDEELTFNLIRNTIYPAVRLMDTYLPGLMKVIYGGATPLEAVEEIEKKS